MKIGEIPVLVLTCDKYAWTWATWQHFWFSNARDHFGPVYWATESAEPTPPVGVKPIITGQVNWTKNAKVACLELKRLGFDRVLLTLEDFWPTPEAKEIPWDSLKVLDVPILGLHARSRLYKSDDILDVGGGVTLGLFQPGSRYQTCTQPTIWKIDTFLSLLKWHEDPWQFEAQGGKRGNARGLYRYFYAVAWYAHGVRRGKYTKAGRAMAQASQTLQA
jgi:hypothetical protein